MLRTVNVEVFYPHPPEKVWQLITNRQLLAKWLMENDFEAHLGHKFCFHNSTLPGINENIKCEVIELDEPRRLVYTWQDSMMCQPSIVAWILEPVEGGTKLQLLHKGFKGKLAGQDELMYQTQPSQNQFISEPKAVTQTLPSKRLQPIILSKYERLDSIILNSLVNGGWEYKLNERLPQLLNK
jgi:uncharacterized protein YndB with AHSA1/START domain